MKKNTVIRYYLKNDMTITSFSYTAGRKSVCPARIEELDMLVEYGFETLYKIYVAKYEQLPSAKAVYLYDLNDSIYLHTDSDLVMWIVRRLRRGLQKPAQYIVPISKIRNYAVQLWHESRGKNLHFWTITDFVNTTHGNMNKALSNYLENLKENYGLKDYIWTTERQKNGRIHYHLIVQIVQNKINDMQRAWECALNNVCGTNITSKNSLRISTERGSKIQNINRCVNYIAKYIGKGRERFDTKAYAVTQNISKKTKVIELTREESEFIIDNFDTKTVVKEDYFTIKQLTIFNEMCNKGADIVDFIKTIVRLSYQKE